MRVGIALGSNVGDRLENLRHARALILNMPGVSIHQPCLNAPVYETEPVGCPPGSAPFLNTVIEIECKSSPPEVLHSLRDIEKQLGRPARHPRNAPRSIDLDILYAEDLQIDSPELVIPHPRLAQRRFVLTPLADIRPDLVLPRQIHPVIELLRVLDDSSQVVQVAATW